MNIRPTRELPENYHRIGTLDITQDRGLLVRMNIFGTGLFFFFALFFAIIGLWLRSAAGDHSISLALTVGLDNSLRFALVALGSTALMIVLHEGVHGFFFWCYTGTRPVFTFHWYYASASAPGWYLPRNPFLITTLAPFVLLSAASVVLFVAAPIAWLPWVWATATFNASGSIGDLMVAVWLFRQPRNCLALDQGYAVTLFSPR